jgi:hypothetical protein
MLARTAPMNTAAAAPVESLRLVGSRGHWHRIVHGKGRALRRLQCLTQKASFAMSSWRPPIMKR